MTYEELLEKIIAKLEQKRPNGKILTKENGASKKETLEDVAATITGEPTNSVDAIPTIDAPIGSSIVKRKELEETEEEEIEEDTKEETKEETKESIPEKADEKPAETGLSIFMV